MNIDQLIKELKDAIENAQSYGLTEVIVFINGIPMRIESIKIDDSDDNLVNLCDGEYCAINTSSI